MRLSDALNVRPRIQVGYRDFDAGGSERFTVPSVLTTYRIDRQTEFNLEVGGRWSTNDSGATVVKQDQVHITAGVSRSF